MVWTSLKNGHDVHSFGMTCVQWPGAWNVSCLAEVSITAMKLVIWGSEPIWNANEWMGCLMAVRTLVAWQHYGFGFRNQVKNRWFFRRFISCKMQLSGICLLDSSRSECQSFLAVTLLVLAQTWFIFYCGEMLHDVERNTRHLSSRLV
jgi:hypothetical protein